MIDNGAMRILLALTVAATLSAAEVRLGKPLTLEQPLPIAALLAKPGEHLGKTVQVRGRITEVCQMMGCWMSLVDENGKALRVKVKDGEIEFPKDSAGKRARAEGTFSKLELTREQAIAHARHEAEEMGRKFDPASIKSGTTIYEIQGTGALIE
jgi:Domain of unknown function (DUF4920)